MPTRTIDSATRLLDRLRIQGYTSEITEKNLIYAIEEVVGADPRTIKSHLAFLAKHGLIQPKKDQQGYYLIDYEKMYAAML